VFHLLIAASQFTTDDTLHFGEVQFFFQALIHDQTRTLALVSTYSPPDLALLEESHKTIWAATYQGAAGLEVIDVKNIRSVIAMCPLPSRNTHFFVAEKLGLEVTALADAYDEE
jgi:hypothetical protein